LLSEVRKFVFILSWRTTRETTSDKHQRTFDQSSVRQSTARHDLLHANETS